MAKKQKVAAGRPIPQPIYKRLNFLYQVANHFSAKSSNFSSQMMNEFKGVREKSVTRIDPSVKRNCCKVCLKAWIPGLTCRLNYDDLQTILTVTCSNCAAVKTYPLNESHSLFDGLTTPSDQVDAVQLPSKTS